MKNFLKYILLLRAYLSVSKDNKKWLLLINLKKNLKVLNLSI